MKLFLIASIVNAIVLNFQQPLKVKEQTLLQVIQSRPDLVVLGQLLAERPEFETALSDPNADLTVFAPLDSAFSKIGHPPPPEAVTEILFYHLVNGTIPSSNLLDGDLLESGLTLESLDGQNQVIKVTTKDTGLITLNYHSVVHESDIVASNGVIHTVEKIVLPPPSLFFTAAHLPLKYAGFILALKYTGLDDIVRSQNSLTVFAPTNKAFQQLGWAKLRFLFSPAGKRILTTGLKSHIAPKILYTETAFAHTLPFVVQTLNIPLLVKADAKAKTILLNGIAHVEDFDVIGANGVLHGIDSFIGVDSADDQVPDDWVHILNKN
ncbi:hypothetical protein HK103_005647 [Boothiomyces macroporosus]|uniref:FAS1 domain-containing protein n=1 Tax=Boothiomyces macroporosus TaxID=261099 RepID=A0AAD5UEW6_9FUNG|nr:hypothetical protein HK103_005647 [Boothiomyces macroporosus]